MSRRLTRWPLVAWGVLALGLGVLVYLTDRDPSRVALLPVGLHLAGGPVFGAAGPWLPSLCHPLAFSLLWAALRPAGATAAYGGCAGWGALNLGLEAIQHPALAGPLAAWVGPQTVLARYAVHGTFDPADLMAAVAGALLAAVLVRQQHLRELDHAC